VGVMCGCVLWCPAAGAAVTHGYVGAVPISAYWLGLAVGPAVGGAGVVERDALFVAGDGVQRFSASGAALDFACVPVVCGGYVEGNRIKGTPSGEFPGTVSVVVDDATGEIFVSAQTGVDVFSASGEYLSKITEVPVSSGAAVTGPLTEAGGLAFDQATGELYVAEEGTVTASEGDAVDVFKVLAGGEAEFVSQLGDGVLAANGGLVQTVAVAEGGLGEPGQVYVTDTKHDVVDVFGSLGTLEGVWSGAGTPAGPFVQGTGLLFVGVDPVSGRVYVADDQHGVVDEFAGGAGEDYLGRLTSTPAGLLSDPVAVAVAPGSGRVYVATHEEAEHTATVDIFGPDIVLPEVLTGEVSGVSTGGGVLGGVVSSGVGGPVSCWFEWGLTEALGSRVPCVGSPVEGEDVAVHAALSGLAPDTKYFYRLQGAYVSDEEAVNLSEEATAECEHVKAADGCFTTLGAGVESESASDVASTSADLGGSIDPNHGATSYFIEYGLTSEYTSRTPVEAVGSGKGAVAESEHVQGLAPGTVYHYRVVAVSEVSPGVLFDTYGVDEVFTTQSSGGPGLLDARVWEMVSPASKEGALVQGPGAPWGVTQAAADGGAFTYLGSGPTEQSVTGYSNAQQVLSRRGEHGWGSVDLATPHNGVVSGSLESGQEYRFFSEDLSQAILQPFGEFEPCHTLEGARQPCLSEAASEQTAFLRDDVTGGYTPLVSRADDTSSPFEPFGQEGNIESGASCPPEKFCGPFFDGASTDAMHVVLSSDEDVQLTAEPAPTGGLYEWNEQAPPAEQLQLVSVLPGSGGPETHFASLGTTAHSGTAGDGEDARHAISEDGSRVFWTSGGETLYMRDMPRRVTIQIGSAELGGKVQGRYQLASADGSRVFFTERRTGLFECEIPESLECVPVRLGEAPANLGGVIGASEDGSYVYWVAANDDLYEDHLVGGVWHLRVVAVVSSADGQAPGRVSPNGLWLSFMSDRSLTGYDNSDVASGEPDEEVYLFNAVSGRLSCVSCDPTGGRPVGVNSQEAGLVDQGNYEGLQGWVSGDLPGWVAFEKPHGGVSRYQPRYLSDSGRVFFDSDGGLVPGDVNGLWDVYEYEPVGVGGCVAGVGSGEVVFKPEREVSGVVEGAGCVGLLSSGESSQESALMDASESGGDVFFMTTAKLSPTDTDDSYDVYDAHECPGAVACAGVPVAEGSGCMGLEACRGGAPGPAVLGAPLSAVFSGSGNVSPVVAPKVTRAQLLQKALKVCRRDRRKGRRVACERQARKRYGPVAKKTTVAKRAVAKKTDRRGGR
jgi:hypothetical protein